MQKAIWNSIISERDRLVYQASGYGEGRIGFGIKPAMLIIDVTYDFVGDKPEPLFESIKRFPASCGEEGWKAIYQIASVLPLMRARHVPIIYAIPDRTPKPAGWLETKNARIGEVIQTPRYNQIVREIAPISGDITIQKPRASIFFNTPLIIMLVALKIDTLLVCGTSTSGCVRASVIDAHANNFRVAVIEECTFDRGEISHKVNLFDMNAKYADVVSVSEVKNYIEKLSYKVTNGK